MKKAALHNLGCKVNAYETEAMQQMLEEAGYEIVSFQETADVYVITFLYPLGGGAADPHQWLDRVPYGLCPAEGTALAGRGKNKKDTLWGVLRQYRGHGPVAAHP